MDDVLLTTLDIGAITKVLHSHVNEFMNYYVKSSWKNALTGSYLLQKTRFAITEGAILGNVLFFQGSSYKFEGIYKQPVWKGWLNTENGISEMGFVSESDAEKLVEGLKDSVKVSWGGEGFLRAEVGDVQILIEATKHPGRYTKSGGNLLNVSWVRWIDGVQDVSDAAYWPLPPNVQEKIKKESWPRALKAGIVNVGGYMRNNIKNKPLGWKVPEEFHNWRTDWWNKDVLILQSFIHQALL